MAEKRGQYQYNDDGTVSTLVSISGADANGGAVNTTTNDALPFDHQATLTNTAVTHTGATVAPTGGNSVQSTWNQVPEGMSDFATNLTMDVAAANIYINILWSEDGSATSGNSSITVSNTEVIKEKTSKQWFPIGGAFYKSMIINGDGAPKTCSANIKFRP